MVLPSASRNVRQLRAVAIATVLAGGLAAALPTPASAGDTQGSTYGRSQSVKVMPEPGTLSEPEATYMAPTGAVETGDLPPPILPDYDGHDAGAGETAGVAPAPDPTLDPAPDFGNAQQDPIPAPVDSANLPAAGAVDMGELPPVMSPGGGGLPHQLWSGTTMEEIEGLFGKLDIPPRSAALHGLWRRLLTTAGESPAGGRTPNHFLALRIDGLYRSGLLQEANAVLGGGTDGHDDPMLLTARARAELGLGETDAACATMKRVRLANTEMPKRVRNDALLVSAYCVSKDKNPDHAGLAAEVARDQGVESAVALAVMDSIAETKTPKIPKSAKVSLIDYKFLSLLGPAMTGRVLAQANPDVLVAIASDSAATEDARLAAAEQAARLNAVDAQGLGRIYKSVEFDPGFMQAPDSAPVDGAERRALFYQTALAQSEPRRRLELSRQLLVGAGRDDLYLPMAQLVAWLIGDVQPSPDMAWFGETAIEAFCAAENYELAMRWALSSGDLMHWLPIIDIADAGNNVPHGSSLRYAEDLIQAGALSPDTVERLATVLDALDYNVPISIWDAAQRAPKTGKGHLPETGVLSQLQDAARQQSYGKTILLAMVTLGPDGGDGAHLLSLGDTIRALKAAGLEADARRLAFEALFSSWPRRGNG